MFTKITIHDSQLPVWPVNILPPPVIGILNVSYAYLKMSKLNYIYFETHLVMCVNIFRVGWEIYPSHFNVES